jgi:hypothetical protein
MYKYDKTASKDLSELLAFHDLWVGDYEADADDIYFNAGSGADSVGFKINQTTGKVEARFEPDPEGEDENGDGLENQWTQYSDEITELLQWHVVDAKTGERRENRKSRKSRKSSRRRKSRRASKN